MAALAGTTAAYQGIVKRQIRKASGSLLWIAAIVIIGAGVVSKPTMITKAPMVVSNTAASCVIGAFSGNSVMVLVQMELILAARCSMEGLVLN